MQSDIELNSTNDGKGYLSVSLELTEERRKEL